MQASAGAEEQLQKLQLELSEAARLRDTYQADAEKQRRRWKRLGSGSGLGERWLLCGGLCRRVRVATEVGWGWTSRV